MSWRRMPSTSPPKGPLGLAARHHCLRHGFSFTTAYHTQFPEYLALRTPIPLRWSYAAVRRFHAAAARTMVATASQQVVLEQHGFTHLVRWSRGVDTALFRPGVKDFLQLPRPIAIYVGRVAVEKNLDAFLELDLPGSKVVVGDGPALADLRERHPDAHFTGFKQGEELVRHLAAADVFVFPSRTDNQPISAFHSQGNPLRRRSHQPPADAARRHDPQARLRHVQPGCRPVCGYCARSRTSFAKR
jgi:glycosyltransferase involved in cell wall biosynthesis